MNEEIKTAAADYRASKEAPPEVSDVKSAWQLEQAIANYDYYSKLAAENLAAIKALTAQNPKQDPNIKIISDAVAGLAVAVAAEASEAFATK